MKYFSKTHDFGYSWSDMVLAFWLRYPTPYSKHVLSEDVVCRWTDGDLLFTRRLLIKTNRMPKWAEMLTPARSVAIVEDSCVDRGHQVLTTYTRNLGYSKLLSVRERCVYSALSADESSVLREARIQSQMRGVVSMVERFGYERFKGNAKNAVGGIRYVLDRMGVQEKQRQEDSVADRKKKQMISEARNAGRKLHDVAVDAKARATRGNVNYN